MNLPKMPVVPVVAAAIVAVVTASPLQASIPELLGKLSLLSDAEVVKELGLSESAQSQVRKLIDRRVDQGGQLFLDVKDLPAEEREQKLAPFREESEDLARRLLSDEQWQKLQQIEVRKQGLLSLNKPEVVKALNLSDKQKQERDRLLAERQQKLVGADSNARRAVNAEYDRHLRNLLSEEQWAAWQKLAGEVPAAAGAEPPAAPQPAAETPADPKEEPAPKDEPGDPSQSDNGKAVPIPQAVIPNQPNDGKLKFNFRYQPWKDVLEWFAEQSDLSLVLDAAPQGTFNYQDDRRYKPAEALDLLNGVLVTKGYTLIRRGRMLLLVNLEDEIPPIFISEVAPDKLDERGTNELVKTRFSLSKVTADEAEDEIKSLIGPTGKIVKLPKAQQVEVTETAGRLRTIRDVLERIENPGGRGELRVFPLKHATIDEVMEISRQLLNIPADLTSPLDGSLRIALDPIGNRIIASGKPDKLAQLEEIVKTVDVPAEGIIEPGVVESPQLEVYAVTGADPQTALAVLQTLLAGLPDVRLALDEKTGNIVAQARPSQHATIKATLEQLQQGGREIEVIQLRKLDPQYAVLSINKLFGITAEGGNPSAPKVDADPITRQLLIRASKPQIEQIRTLLEKMGESDAGEGENLASKSTLRMVPLSGRQMQRVLEQAQAVWPIRRPNKIRIVRPAQSIPTRRPGEDSGNPLDRFLPPDEDNRPLPPPEKSPPQENPEARKTTRLTPQFRLASQVSADGETAAAANNDQPAAQPEGPKTVPGAEIVVIPTPDGLMIASQDLEALDEFEALLSNLATASSKSQFTVFYLNSASAVVVAETLNQIFGGSSASSDGGGGGSLLGDVASAALGDAGGGLLGGLLGLGGGGGGGSLLGGGSVQIIPETRLNALIVRAPPADLDTIEQLLEVLDQGDPPETEVAAKPRMIPVRNTNANDVASVLRQVYQDRIAGSSSQSRRPSPEEFIRALRGGRGRRGGNSSQAAEQMQKLSIGVDQRTNSLIVVSTQPMFEEIQRLVQTIDVATTDNDETVRVVSLKRGNVSSVQSAISAILGDAVTTQGTSGSSQQPSSRSSSGSSRTSSGRDSDSGRPQFDQDAQESFRRRIEFFNRLRERFQRDQSGGDSGRGRPGGSSGRGGFGRGR